MDKSIICTYSFHTISKEYRFKQLFPNFYSEIQSINFPDEFSWSQKLYHYLHNDLEFNLGICPICGKRCKYKSISLGYCEFCSINCLNKSEKHKKIVKNTILTKYNGGKNEFYQKRYDSTKNTCLEKYGVENPSQIEEVKKKKEETTFNHFGGYTFQSKELRDKVENTCLKLYGVKNGGCSKQALEKIRLSKKKHHTTTYSSLEEYFCEYLTSNNISFERQYKDFHRYPFSCDFYLPNCDTFIEIQGHWSHGKHPFNPNNESDITILNKWKEKSQHSHFYKSAINVWTNRDVKKRTVAKQNNLSFIEIFANNQEQLYSYIEKIKDGLK